MRNFIFVAAVALTAFVGSALAAQKPAPAVESKATVKTQTLAQIWKSETTKREYRVRVENNVFYAEWVNPPPVAAKFGAYIRTECRRLGAKWVGTSRILIPCAKEGEAEPKRACPMTMRFELDSISPERITGRAETPNTKDLDCEKCEVRQTHWGAFVWVPKR